MPLASKPRNSSSHKKSCSGSRQPKTAWLHQPEHPLLQGRPLLQVAAERRHTRAGPDHDHRLVRVLGRAERDVWLVDEPIDGCPERLLSQVIGADATDHPVTAAGGSLDRTDGDAAGLR